MKKVYRYMLKYTPGYILCLICMFLAIGLDMLYPQITKIIINDIFGTANFKKLTMLLVAIVLVGIGRSIFGYCKEFTSDVIGAKIGTDMRKDLFRHIQSLSVDYFDDANTGELMARVKDDVDKVRFALGFVGVFASSK